MTDEELQVSGPHLFPPEMYPIIFRAFRVDTGEQVWENQITILDLKPGHGLSAVYMPPLAKELGVDIEVEIEYGDGTKDRTRPAR